MKASLPGSSGPPIWKVLAAFAAIYFIWGSAYLMIKWTLDGFPPLIMAGVRFLVPGCLLIAFASWRGIPGPAPAQWRSAFVAGALLILFGNGCFAWASQKLPSGVTCLFIAPTPLWIVGLNWLSKGGKRPSLRIVSGLLTGCLGLALLAFSKTASMVGASVHESSLDPYAVAAALLGPVAWALGTTYCRTAKLPDSLILNVGMQQAAGGLLLLGAALFLHEFSEFDLAAVPLRSWGSMLYLMVLVSMVAYMAYVWLLQHVAPAKVSTYAYVNPVIALFLGWLLNGEAIHRSTFEAAAVIILAGVLITTDRTHQEKPAQWKAPAADGIADH